MIVVNSIYQEGLINQIEASGHALFDHIGKDIVCASASTIFIVTINAIEHLGFIAHIDVKIESGYFKVSVKKNQKEVLALLENLIYSIKDLEQQFPKNIKYQREG